MYFNINLQGFYGTLQVISKKLPADQLKPFVDLVQEGLVDPQSHSSSGACVVLNGVMKTRGAELLKEVNMGLFMCLFEYGNQTLKE